jgi:hypothetical protein
MMEYPPLQHIAAMVISHNGELKGPFDLDIIEAFIFSVRRVSRFAPEPRLCPSIAALPAHAAIPLPITRHQKPQQGRTKSIASANRSISNPEQMLPLAKFALKTHALGDLECRDDTCSISLLGFSRHAVEGVASPSIGMMVRSPFRRWPRPRTERLLFST